VINIFLHVRRDTVQAQPEAILEWLRSRYIQDDGRIYIRMSEYKAEFGDRTDIFYQILSALARHGLIKVERWRLERMAAPKQPRYGQRRSLSPSWDPVELLYAVEPINLSASIEFECYATEQVKQIPWPDDVREEIWRAADCCCTYCKKPLDLGQVIIDHDVPRGRGGGNERSNLVAACMQCNSGKRARTGDEYRTALASINSLLLVSPQQSGASRG
jgi:hypothetical protein